MNSGRNGGPAQASGVHPGSTDRRDVLRASLLAGITYAPPTLTAARPFAGLSSSLTVTSISPTSGGEGTIVTIQGSGFSSVPADNRVLLADATFATVLTASPTQLTARVEHVPVAQTGPVRVSCGATTTSAAPIVAASGGTQLSASGYTSFSGFATAQGPLFSVVPSCSLPQPFSGGCSPSACCTFSNGANGNAALGIWPLGDWEAGNRYLAHFSNYTVPAGPGAITSLTLSITVDSVGPLTCCPGWIACVDLLVTIIGSTGVLGAFNTSDSCTVNPTTNGFLTLVYSGGTQSLNWICLVP